MATVESSTCIVEFDKYCGSCKHRGKKETDEPCSECLENPVNTDSLRPTRWEKA